MGAGLVLVHLWLYDCVVTVQSLTLKKKRSQFSNRQDSDSFCKNLHLGYEVKVEDIPQGDGLVQRKIVGLHLF